MVLPLPQKQCNFTSVTVASLSECTPMYVLQGVTGVITQQKIREKCGPSHNKPHDQREKKSSLIFAAKSNLKCAQNCFLLASPFIHVPQDAAGVINPTKNSDPPIINPIIREREKNFSNFCRKIQSQTCPRLPLVGVHAHTTALGHHWCD